jgi:hypothetical protein
VYPLDTIVILELRGLARDILPMDAKTFGLPGVRTLNLFSPA